ncbi:hypothetical protein Flavo103_16640 [Flavobacterium collinsii]|uniref:DUF6630 family protein n=1 Tax=Flavobacterium collinsii TaxID=1114861 RepID=UPI0022C1DEBD|nr:hypothetical protein [Flavobacterium collinsii]GIQ58528.1 hypothetical protein Flavo103_16640 [Flavobacterium collinsii]
MKNFFSNFFGRNNDPESIVSFDVLNSIYTYLQNGSGRVDFKMKGIHDAVSATMYSFPDSFDHEDSRIEIEKSGFKNAYEILNELYKKVNIAPLSNEEMLEEPVYNYLHIEFYSEPSSEMKKHLKHVLQNFIIIFCCTNSLESNDFKMLYSNSYFFDYTKGLLEAEPVDIEAPKNEIEKIGFKDFKTVLQGICQYMEIELPSTIILPSAESLMTDEVSIDHFKEFLQLISRGEIEEELLEGQSQVLFDNFGLEEEDEDYDYEFDFFEGINSWHSDWKFDPEDAQYFISEMIGEDFTFEYPEETYSHDLFPYIQKELAKQDLELMSYDTKGDSYLFFVANKNDVGRILELSEITEMGIDRLI